MHLQTSHILILGDEGVGKRSIIHTYIHDQDRPADYDPASEPRYRTEITVNGSMQRLELLSLNPNTLSEYPSLSSRVLRDVDGFIFVYDISSAESFEGIKKTYNELRKERNHRPVILVGNKADKIDTREMSTEAGRQLALNWHCDFAEITATRNGGANEVFLNLATQIHQMHQKNQAREARKTPTNRRLSMISTLDQTQRKVESSFDRLWNRILCWILGYDRRLRFEPISGLEAFQFPPIPTVSSFSLPEKWSVWRNRSSADTTLRDFEERGSGKDR
ncbi:P-loop containing nucleoside triphosphate hydrolase protein [Leptodontidium sp. MPI-SDFR-AT-0119]|nr:P-loop containing nucleoside triphosphate hydrolase protein [Leptodontidium sp. MPI-SDFR-AT-0119]